MHACLWRDGQVVDLGIATPMFSSEASDINDGGQIVGRYNDFASIRACMWQNGAMTDLGSFGGSLNTAVAINNDGVVVGMSRDQFGDDRVFVWQNGVMRRLDDRLCGGARVAGINDSGAVVGTLGSRAFCWKDGVITDLGVLALDSITARLRVLTTMVTLLVVLATRQMTASSTIRVCGETEPSLIWVYKTATIGAWPYASIGVARL